LARHRVKLKESDLAALYMFQLTEQEPSALRSQYASSDATPGGRGRHRKYLPYAFTDHAAIMAANLLSSSRAIEGAAHVVGAFLRMRELAAMRGDLAKQLAERKEKTEALAMNHDTISRNSRARLKQLFDRPRKTHDVARAA
jgi:hypothetical protein